MVPTKPDLLPIVEELRTLEPIFHTQAFGLTRQDRESRMSSEYWESGASGRIYTRDFILNHMEPEHFNDAMASGWKTREHAVMALGSDTFLFTYTLLQGERVTRRATIWRTSPAGWTILFHQGTVVTDANVKQ